MRRSRMTKLGSAFVSALSAITFLGASQQVLANAEDLNGAIYVSSNSKGQVLIFPYYTVRDGKKTVINVFNVSNKTIAAKVRFHESHNSRDVLDFNVVLSPSDKWSGTIEMGTTGAVFKTRDNTCTVPQIPTTGVALNESAYSGGTFADVDADQTKDRMNEGYVEVIAMGVAEAGPAAGFVAGAVVAPATGNVAYDSTHVNGVPRDCAAVTAKFLAGPNAAAYPLATTYRGIVGANGDPDAADEFDRMRNNFNPLRGALTIIDEEDGVGFGTSALALGDWTRGLSNNTSNHITAQQFPYFLEPTIASSRGIWDVRNLTAVDRALEAHLVINEWANNPTNGAATDWIIQFPTKAFHVDIPYADNLALTGCDPSNIQAAYNSYRAGWRTNPVCNAATTNAGLAEIINPFENRFGPNGSAVTVATTTYDKEEREGSPDGVSFSPAQPGASNALPWESNVITFGGPSVLSSSSPELMLDPVGTIPGAEANGMAVLEFSNADTLAATYMRNGGLPVIGFVAKERNEGDSSKTYGQIMSHTYENVDTAVNAGPL